MTLAFNEPVFENVHFFTNINFPTLCHWPRRHRRGCQTPTLFNEGRWHISAGTRHTWARAYPISQRMNQKVRKVRRKN